MSVKVLNHVFEHAECSGNDRVVLLVLADHAHDDGTQAFPAHDTIAKKARISPRTVRDCLRRLEKAGAIRRAGKVGRTISYDVEMGIPAEAAASSDDDIPADPSTKAADSRQDSGSGLPTNRKEPSEPSTSTGTEPLTPTDEAIWKSVREPLQHVAVSKQTKVAVDPVIAACMKYADRAHSIEAERFAQYWMNGRGQNRPLTDVAKAWANWLRTSPPATAYNGHAPGSRTAGRRNGRAVQPTGDDLRAMAAAARAEGR